MDLMFIILALQSGGYRQRPSEGRSIMSFPPLMNEVFYHSVPGQPFSLSLCESIYRNLQSVSLPPSLSVSRFTEISSQSLSLSLCELIYRNLQPVSLSLSVSRFTKISSQCFNNDARVHFSLHEGLCAVVADVTS